MSRLIRSVILCLAAALVVGCTGRAVLNLDQSLPADGRRTTAQVQEAIHKALAQQQWTLQQDNGSVIYAEITVRERHHAEISIPYSSQQYSIKLRSSRGLDEENGQIHRNYNNWVVLLNERIQQNLGLTPTAR
ncbi:hypothetical protein N5J43_17985 [Pseudomonas nicosulfuronedens]|uniref:Lipoprotein n=1 Tax=Pseudomonas nicosulfuronedens TaxID=2571105 RepID=A0A5R9R112_9PSED|nr:hypothetical protein [Pseudomonas nicosulfuronedens]MDH1008639.1 hypothetical protein [Pseudomonas nicosulfuronedens]MDH1980848.1 hypothetical protein [Pseudomonas nicosulfuronedens]MDH2028872.1 hypothetical protein [Pseudomonas nicosulfuronedens]TLX76271.1 hypothetical protein FAS41_14885 [Pseudomonas nicosulfuronedens]